METEYKMSKVNVTKALTFRMTRQMIEMATMYVTTNLMLVGMTKNISQILRLAIH